MKRILIITSANTGAGHKSISDSLAEQFSVMPDVEVKTIDGFALLGRVGIHGSKQYNYMLRRTPAVFNKAWRFTMAHPPRLTAAAHLCSRRFRNCIHSFHPDLILTVHSLFNSMITRMLKRYSLDIPVVVLQADLVDIHSTWCNPDAFMTICPTQEAYDSSIRQGVPPEKLKIMGFPVRERFSIAAQEGGPGDYDPSRPLRCLLMSGGEGSGGLEAYAEAILTGTDAEVTIICGHNRRLYNHLQKSLCRQYSGRIRVHGFVTDVEQEMLHNDVLIARGSPNTLFEAVTVNIPVIMTGPLPEQEKGNPGLMSSHHLGVICNSPEDVPELLRSLISDDAARLKKIRAAQHAFRSDENARKIAVYTAGLAEPLEYTLEHARRNSIRHQRIRKKKSPASRV